MKRALFILFLMHAALFCGAAESWCFQGMTHRTALDWHPADGRHCEISIDFAILSRLAKQTVPPEANAIRFSAQTPDGEQAVPAAVTGRNGSTLHLRFTLPERTQKATLYFGGKGKTGGKAVPAPALVSDARKPEGWKPVLGTWTIRAEGKALYFHTPTVNSAAVCKDFPLPAGTEPGSPAVLEFAFRSLSKLPWNFSLAVSQLDEHGKPLPSSVTDPRWSSMFAAGPREVVNRAAGRLDPRARTLRVFLRTYTSPAKLDHYGKPLAEKRQGEAEFLLTDLQIRSGTVLRFPGRNPAQFTAGIDGGKAYHLNGKHAPFFNANPPCVWSEGVKNLTAQTEYHWSKGDGTFEAWIKPEFTAEDKENTIIEAYQNFRKTLLNLVYRPTGKQFHLTIRDFREKTVSLTANAELPAKKWSHIAVCWSGKNGIALFLNGKKIAANADFHFAPAELERAKRCDDIMPDNISLGIAARPVRNIPTAMRPSELLKGALDKVRISTRARYTDDFTPDRDLRCDESTCAFFDYENTFDGTHGTGDRFIAGSLVSYDSPLADVMTAERRENGTVRTETVRVIPEKIVPENHPHNTLPTCNYPQMPAVQDFHAAREPRKRTFSIRSGETVRITVPEKVYMDSLTISCPPDGKPLEGPILLNSGDLDVRSYGDLADTMFSADEKLSDAERTIRMFGFMYRVSDYFMSHQPRMTEQNTLGGAEYDGLRQLVSYCGFECGPLNNLTMNMFIYLLRLPASMTAGNFHSFEQVFYDGRWRLFDLSAQTYFPSRRQNDAASLEEIEEDPVLLSRFRFLGSYHFYRLRAREYSRWGLQPQPRRVYTLNPGESFRVCWQNNGVYNDLQRTTAQAAERLKSVGRDVTAETGVRASRKNDRIKQVDRPFPHYASGFLTFDGKVSAANPAFSQVTDKSFVYRVNLPYPVVAASCRAEGTGLVYEISYDNGKNWRRLPVSGDGTCRLTLEVRARHDYLIRVTGSRSGKFHSETNVQMNPRVLTGALHQGENALTLKSDVPGKALISYAYRADTGKTIKLGNVLSWGAIPGEEKQMIPLNPGEKWEISAENLSPDARLETTRGIRAERNGGTIRISATDPAARIGGLTIRDGNAVKQIAVAVVPGSRWIPASKMRAESGAELLPPDDTRTMPVLKSKKGNIKVVYPFAPIRAGRYMVFHIGRNPLKTNLSILIRREENGKAGMPLLRKTNNAAEFYKVEKLLWRFRWDYPIQGVYPYEMMRALKFPACDSMTVRYMCPDLEIAGALLLPADDPDFLSEFRKYCCGFNYQPLKFQKSERSL